MFKRSMGLLGAAACAMAFVSCGGDPFAKSIYTAQPKVVTYQDYLAANAALPADGTKGILAYGAEKAKIKKGSLTFKDSDGDKKLDKYEDWRLSARERAADLVSQMSPEEKLGLLSWGGNSGISSMSKAADGTLAYGIQGVEADGTITETVTSAKGPATTMAYSAAVDGLRYANNAIELPPLDEVKYNNNLQGLVERSKWGIPYVLSSDPAHNGWNGNELPASQLSQWPYYLGLGALDDLAVTKDFGQTVASEFRMLGRHMMLGPQADIASEPRYARVQHLFHSDPDIVASHVSVMIKALQGGDELKPTGIAATVKHFPGSGSVEEGMDSHTFAGRYSVYPGNDFDAHLKPFTAAIDAKVAAVMALYSIVDNPAYQDQVNGKGVEEGSAFSKTLMTDTLKTKMGFDGAVVSDWGVAKSSAWGHEDIKGTGAILAEMLNAGTYQYGGDNLTKLWKDALAQGLITVEKIDEAAVRSLELQFKLGLFENPYVDLTEAAAFWDPNGNAMKLRVAAGKKAMSKAIVLAENREVATGVSTVPVLATNADYLSAMDTNKNGTFDVYFDSAFPDADSGQAKTKAFSNDKQYLSVTFVDSIEKADMAIVRIFSRGATYFGTQGGTPLSFEAPVMEWDREKQAYTDKKVPVLEKTAQAFGQFGAWSFNDWSQLGGGGMVGQGYMTYLGGKESKAIIDRALAAKKKNPGLKLVVGMTASRPGIVSSFADKVDALYIDFAATDSAFLDIVFWQDGIEPKGRLPIEIPSDDASVEAQAEDVPGDTANPTYEVGYGLGYAAIGGYGYGN